MPIVDNSRWRFVITDMSGNTSTGGGAVLNASARQYSHSKSAGRTAQFSINIDNPVANRLMTSDCLMKVYRRNRLGVWNLLMTGDVIHAEEAGQGNVGQITVLGSDPYWRLQRRMVGTGVDSIGRGAGYQIGTVSSLVDIGQMMSQTLGTINAAFYTGLQLGTVQSSTSSYLGLVYMQNVGDLFQQWSNILGGPDFDIAPVEPTGFMPNTTIGTLNIYTALGQNRPNTIFEYGCGQHNVATYDRLLTKDGLCNQAFSTPPGFPDLAGSGDTMAIGQDTASQNAISLYQDEVSADLASLALRQELANEYVQVRKYARQQIVFTPTVDCPLDYQVDYSVGDTVGARAWANGGYRYNGTARIYDLMMAIDDNDAETPALTLIPGG